LLAWLVCGAALSSAASAQTGGLRGHFAKGGQQLSLRGGYAVGFPLVADADDDSARVRLGAFAPRWATGISELRGRGRWYEGRFEAGLEAQLLRATRPHDGVGGGLVADLRFDFLRGERVAPFLAFGAGVSSIDFDLDDQSDGFNFLLQGGAGAHVFVTPRAALTAELRWHHISNAGLGDSNHGVNSALFLVGPTFFWE
jgi:hypothetical protein